MTCNVRDVVHGIHSEQQTFQKIKPLQYRAGGTAYRGLGCPSWWKYRKHGIQIRKREFRSLIKGGSKIVCQGHNRRLAVLGLFGHAFSAAKRVDSDNCAVDQWPPLLVCCAGGTYCLSGCQTDSHWIYTSTWSSSGFHFC